MGYIPENEEQAMSGGAANTTSTGGGGWDWLGKLLGGLGGAASGVYNQLGGGSGVLNLGILTALSKYLQDQQSKSSVNPSEAMRTSDNMRQFYANKMRDASLGASSVQPNASMRDVAITGAEQRAFRPAIAPNVAAPIGGTPPARFNPYQPTQGVTPGSPGLPVGLPMTQPPAMGGAVNPAILARLQQMMTRNPMNAVR